MQPKYPDVEVALTGQDGNRFFIISRVSKALRAAGYIGMDEIDTFVAEATSSDYNHLLQTCMKWVSIS